MSGEKSVESVFAVSSKFDEADMIQFVTRAQKNFRFFFSFHSKKTKPKISQMEKESKIATLEALIDRFLCVRHAREPFIYLQVPQFKGIFPFIRARRMKIKQAIYIAFCVLCVFYFFRFVDPLSLSHNPLLLRAGFYRHLDFCVCIK